MLKALEEQGIKPDIISGVSSGAVVGALYADGYSPEEIAMLFEDISFRQMTKLQIPDGGFFRIDAFEKFMTKTLRAKTFEELKIPLRIVATNLDKGQSVVFSSGKLVDEWKILLKVVKPVQGFGFEPAVGQRVSAKVFMDPSKRNWKRRLVITLSG